MLSVDLLSWTPDVPLSPSAFADKRQSTSVHRYDPTTCRESVDEVDRHCRGDRGMCVVGGRNQAGTEEYAQIGFPTVFNRRCEGEHFAGAGVQLDAVWILRAVWIENVVPDRAGVAVVTVCGVERQHPAPRQAVFQRAVDKEGSAGLSVPTESLSCAVNTDVFYVQVARKRLRHIEPHAQNAVIR